VDEQQARPEQDNMVFYIISPIMLFLGANVVVIIQVGFRKWKRLGLFYISGFRQL